MISKKRIIQSTVVFTGLVLASFIIGFSARAVSDLFAQNLMVTFGGALFSAALTFFLLQMSKFSKD